jgi:hypothetical protein
MHVRKVGFLLTLLCVNESMVAQYIYAEYRIV